MPNIFPYFRPWKMLTPSLALSSIAGNLDEGHEVAIADLVLKREDVRGAVLEALEKTKPDIVGLSAMTFQYDTAIKIARLIREHKPEIKIALGGYHATLMYREIAESCDSQYFDFLLRGEADLSFNELVGALEGTRPLTSVDGLSFRENGSFVHNGPRKVEDLGRIKPPNRNVRIWGGYHAMGLVYDTIESSRGCVMGCSFCSIRHMYGKTFRKYDVSRVIQDIENARARGVECLFFTDDNITLDVERFEQLIDEIIRRGYNDLVYIIQASSAGIVQSERLAEKMAAGGFSVVFLGIENISKKNLSVLNKGDIAEKSVRAVEILKRNKIYVIGGFIIGNPDDNYDDIEENYKFARKMKVGVHDQILTPYLKTEMRDELLKQGLVTNTDNYRLYNGHFANVKTRHLSDDDLNFIKYRMVQKYALPLFEGFIIERRAVIKFFLKTLKRKMRFAIWDTISHKIKMYFMPERKRFEADLERCLNENAFNV